MRDIRLILYLLLTSVFSLCAANVSDNNDSQELDHWMKAVEQAENNQDINAAVKAYTGAIKACKKMEDQSKLPQLMYSYAIILTYSGNYVTAISTLGEVYGMVENGKDKTLEARVMMQLGIIHFFMEEWDTSLSYYQRARELASEVKSDQGLSIAYNNIGNIFEKKLQFDKAIQSYKNCLEIQKSVKDSATIGNVTYNLGYCYFELNRKKEAFPYFIEALKISKTIGDAEIESLALLGLGKFYMENKDYARAGSYVSESEKVASVTGYRQVLAEIYTLKSELEETKGNYQEALHFERLHRALADSIFKEESLTKLKNFQVKYETQKKENEIRLYRTQISRQHAREITGIIGLLLAFIVIVLVWLHYRLQRKRADELSHINAMKDRFFSIISHDLKNPAISQQLALQSLDDKIDSEKQPELKMQVDEMLQASNNQVELLSNLLNWARVHNGKMNYMPSRFYFGSVVREVTKQTQEAFANKEMQLIIDVPEDTVVETDRDMVSIILRNLLNNAVKFSQRGGKVSLSAKAEGDLIKVSVMDQGVGMSEATKAKLFHIDQRISTAGTEGEMGTGLGLEVCREMAVHCGGNLEVESEEGKGTTIRFTVKKSES